MRNIAKEWRNLHEARAIMKRVKRELKELDKLMVLAQQEICQPKYA